MKIAAPMIIGIATSLLATNLGFEINTVQYWLVFATGIVCYIVGQSVGK